MKREEEREIQFCSAVDRREEEDDEDEDDEERERRERWSVQREREFRWGRIKFLPIC